jgi:hypothetical protein
MTAQVRQLARTGRKTVKEMRPARKRVWPFSAQSEFSDAKGAHTTGRMSV